MISPPVSQELRDLPEAKRCVRIVDGEPWVTVAFHDAFVAEMRARWARDIERLNLVKAALEAEV